MNRESVIIRLRDHEEDLKSAGVVSLRLFGSVARGDARPDSDVDLMARFDKTLCRTLFDYAGVEGLLSRAQLHLGHMLNGIEAIESFTQGRRSEIFAPTP